MLDTHRDGSARQRDLGPSHRFRDLDPIFASDRKYREGMKASSDALLRGLARMEVDRLRRIAMRESMGL